MKRKRIVGVILSITMMLSLLPIVASAEYEFGTYKDFRYRKTQDHIEIISYTGTQTSIDIPSEIDGIPVTDIAWNVSGLRNMTNIYIPNSITNIGMAFYNQCDNLENIEVDMNNSIYSSIDGVLLNKDQTELIKYPPQKIQSEYIIPDSVITIKNSAFEQNEYLNTITIPNTVNTIGSSSFKGCTNLIDVSIPDSVTSIGISAFENCVNLTEIKLSQNLNNIGGGAFENTDVYNDKNNWQNGILYINNYLIAAEQNIVGEYIVNKNTKYIANGAFDRCLNLESVILPDSIKGIGFWSFHSCKALKKIYIPENMTILDPLAFEANYSFDIYYGGSKEKWDSCLETQLWGGMSPESYSITIHYNATGIESPKISNINIVPNSDSTGENAEIQLDTVEYDSTLITLFCNDKTPIENKLTTISAGDMSKTVAIPDNADSVKVFIWDSLEGMRPLCEAKTKSIE